MKNIFLTLIFLLTLGQVVMAQDQPLSELTKNMSVIIDGRILKENRDTLIGIDKVVEYATIIKDKEKMVRFGVQNENGIMVIITKSQSKSPDNVQMKDMLVKMGIEDSTVFKDIPGSVNDSLKKVHDFASIEHVPEFPGGFKAFYKYLGNNIRYPRDAQRAKVQGTVLLSFVIERDGSITDVELLKGVMESLDEEAIRVVSASPKWNPGMQDNRLVRVKFNINVNFHLGK
ncbi:energy transducer TonB [Pedobacter rhizosphaerae]|uniref:TonB family C-terminal domain-containing protein n=1 Tax=Pedobacter rhizosphaerae TaxID=390241 RepID=A0A1H9LK19_9SPHI|nr:energy transducer TonB [Pedobacter rhizosphaerae]SER11851.1 TonB family C-terminal domain-containing protein [Pedobacter rhizosphaerae]